MLPNICSLYTEILKQHRQAFVFSGEGLLSLPLLPAVARFFEGQVACSLVLSHIFPYTPDRPLAKASARAMLLSSFYTSCKLEQLPPRPVSYPFCASGKLTVSPDQTYFNAEEELKRIVWKNSPHPPVPTEVIDRLGHLAP